MLAIAFGVCLFLLKREAARQGFKSSQIADLAFWVLVFGLLGARIFYILFNFQFYIENPREIIMLSHGGLIWYGGLFSALIFAAAFLKAKKLPLLSTLDLFAPFLAFGQALGRIGCFLNGCCYGKPVSWGVYFPVHGERLHPTQIYSAFNLLIIFLVLRALQKKSSRPGQVLFLYLLLAPLERFIVEFYRGDSTQIFSGLTGFQLISLVIMAIALYANLYFYCRKRR